MPKNLFCGVMLTVGLQTLTVLVNACSVKCKSNASVTLKLKEHKEYLYSISQHAEPPKITIEEIPSLQQSSPNMNTPKLAEKRKKREKKIVQSYCLNVHCKKDAY